MLGGVEGGVGGLVEKKKKKKNNEYNVVILFMRGVPAIPFSLSHQMRRIL